MTCWVADASPLIFLARLGHLGLLRHAGRSVLVPPGAFAETQAVDDSAAAELRDASSAWLTIREVRNSTAIALVCADLGRGESEAIVLASEVGAERLVVDDLEARRFAVRCGLNVVGTLGILLAAKLEDKLPSLTAECDRLERVGFRIDQPLRAAVLRRAGEFE